MTRFRTTNFRYRYNSYATRIFPFQTRSQTARPIDMFIRPIPQIYDFKVDADWHQLTLYNPHSDEMIELSVPLSGDMVEGALDLDATETYYFYDFWNDCLQAKQKADQPLIQHLRPGEARMLSVRRVRPYPQVLSTNRHIMQGMLELSHVRWLETAKMLLGFAQCVQDDPFKIVIASNGKKFHKCIIQQKDRSLSSHVRLLDDQLITIEWTVPISGEVMWAVFFE
ncbi:MAG: hypothetical protein ONA69_06865 [candidate division KSB1 bacterium]|nr:hypothetical protein [candidate division KSB1 bacterium]